jgi:hypothetical protein
MKHCATVWLAAVFFVMGGIGMADEGKPAYSLCLDTGNIVISNGETPVLRYRYDHFYKPYIRELCTPSGINILRDAPHDHLHHHGVMMAFKVDGVNFWEEAGKSGIEEHLTFADTRVAETGGVPAVSFREQLKWKAPDGPPLLEENRVVAAACEPDSTQVVQASFFQPAGDTVELGGNHYHGIGMRFTESIDATAAFLYTGGEPGEVVRGDECLTPGRWCAMRAEADGKPVTVLMVADEKNTRPTLWFTMKTPFSYLSATWNLWKEPLTLKKGESFKAAYTIVVWDGHQSREDILAYIEAM